jgi:hypothetical protein
MRIVEIRHIKMLMDIEMKKMEKLVVTACSGMLLWHLFGKREENNDKQLDPKVLPRYSTRDASQAYCGESGFVAQQTVTQWGVIC